MRITRDCFYLTLNKLFGAPYVLIEYFFVVKNKLSEMEVLNLYLLQNISESTYRLY